MGQKRYFSEENWQKFFHRKQTFIDFSKWNLIKGIFIKSSQIYVELTCELDPLSHLLLVVVHHVQVSFES